MRRSSRTATGTTASAQAQSARSCAHYTSTSTANATRRLDQSSLEVRAQVGKCGLKHRSTRAQTPQRSLRNVAASDMQTRRAEHHLRWLCDCVSRRALCRFGQHTLRQAQAASLWAASAAKCAPRIPPEGACSPEWLAKSVNVRKMAAEHCALCAHALWRRPPQTHIQLPPVRKSELTVLGWALLL